MGKLDVSVLRYLGADEFRIMMAIEKGMKNHEFSVLKRMYQTTPIDPPCSCLRCVPLGIYSKYTKI